MDNVIQLIPRCRTPIHSLYLDIQGRFNQAQNSINAAQGLAEGFGIALGLRNLIAEDARDGIEARATVFLAAARTAEQLCLDMEETLTYRQAEFISAGSTYVERKVQLIDGQRMAVHAQAILTGILSDVAELKSGKTVGSASRLHLEERAGYLQQCIQTLLVKIAA